VYDDEGSFASLVISNHYSDAGDTNAHEHSDHGAPVRMCPCYQLDSDVFHTLLSSASARPLVHLSDLLQLCSYLEVPACYLTRSSVVPEKYIALFSLLVPW
jgi:hypothetical protein